MKNTYLLIAEVLRYELLKIKPYYEKLFKLKLEKEL